MYGVENYEIELGQAPPTYTTGYYNVNKLYKLYVNKTCNGNVIFIYCLF